MKKLSKMVKLTDPLTQKKEPGRKKTGFTLLETMIGVFLMGVVFIGTMSLFTGTMATASKVNTTTTASVATANIMQRLSSEMKEAFLFALPTGSDTNWPAGEAVANYQYKDSANVLHYTGIYLRYPQNAPAINVFLLAASDPAAVSDVYDRSKVSGSTPNDVLYYRGNPDGTPCPRPIAGQPKSGTCLWAKIGAKLVKIADNIASEIAGKGAAPKETAVQFEKTASGSALVKVVCGDFSTINGQVTSDTADGKVLNEGFGGREVAMRNAAPSNLTGDKGDHVTLDMPSGAPSATPPPSTGLPATATAPPSPSPTPTPTPSPTPTPYRAPTPTPTPTPFRTPTPTPTPTPFRTPTPTPTPTPIRIG